MTFFEKHTSSVTTMQYHPLRYLELLPFDDMLRANGFDNSSVVYSFDEFRKLYNDAVETMQHYRYKLSKQIHEIIMRFEWKDNGFCG